jgi:hypothetical protein
MSHTIDVQEATNFRNAGHDVRIEFRMQRESTMIVDTFDQLEVWGVNQADYPVCIAYSVGTAGLVRGTWLLPPQSNTLMRRANVPSGTHWFIKRQSAADPNCANWPRE